MKNWTIRTKYIPADNTHGARIVAKCNGKQKSIPYPYQLTGEAVHRKAAQAWIDHHMSRNGWEDTSRFKLTTHYKGGNWSFEIHT